MTLMNLEIHRNWFIAGSLLLMLLMSIPTITLFVHIPSGAQRYSELWILDSNHTADSYPFNVTVGLAYTIYLGVRNHLGTPAYYRTYTKLGSGSQQLPVSYSSTPSPLPILGQFDFVVEDGAAWETPLVFKILNAQVQNNSMVVSDFSINDVTFRVNATSMWDSSRRGFYYQLLSELWLYDIASQEFQYHNRLVQLWLNASI